MPLYEFTTELATLEPPPPEMKEFLAGIADDREAMEVFVSVNAAALSPEQLFDPGGRQVLDRGSPGQLSCRPRSPGMLSARRTPSSAAATSNGASVTSSGQASTTWFAQLTQRAMVT
jgi:hypothetical protein